jgi:PleD family two-component response regulator
MNSPARLLEGQSSDGTNPPVRELAADVLKRRVVRRRQMLTIQEELAELDELTGSFNRRCIMRMLEDEIARVSA